VANSGQRLVTVVESDLLAFGQSIITALKNTTGHGDPDRGDVFAQARSNLEGVTETLRSARPGNGWDGAGSHAYADQNTRQQMRTGAMADADHEVHKVLCREAAQITLRRGHLDEQCDLLADTGHAMSPLRAAPRSGDATTLAIELTALQTALAESYRQINQLQSEVAQNAADLQQAVGRYCAVADGAELTGAAVQIALDSDPLQEPVATRLDFDSPPEPPTGTPLRDGR
jgi:ESX secretion-associated protein EspA/E